MLCLFKYLARWPVNVQNCCLVGAVARARRIGFPFILNIGHLNDVTKNNVQAPESRQN